MRVQDIMTSPVRTVSPSATAEAAWETMKTHGINHVVVTTGGSVVGVLSNRDAGGRKGAAVRAGRSVEELMTSPVVTVEPTTTVRKAANLMRGRTIGCLVVLDKGRVAGIVTTADVLALIGRGLERPRATTSRWTLKHRVPHRPRSAATGVW